RVKNMDAEKHLVHAATDEHVVTCDHASEMSVSPMRLEPAEAGAEKSDGDRGQRGECKPMREKENAAAVDPERSEVGNEHRHQIEPTDGPMLRVPFRVEQHPRPCRQRADAGNRVNPSKP